MKCPVVGCNEKIKPRLMWKHVQRQKGLPDLVDGQETLGRYEAHCNYANSHYKKIWESDLPEKEKWKLIGIEEKKKPQQQASQLHQRKVQKAKQDWQKDQVEKANQIQDPKRRMSVKGALMAMAGIGAAYLFGRMPSIAEAVTPNPSPTVGKNLFQLPQVADESDLPSNPAIGQSFFVIDANDAITWNGNKCVYSQPAEAAIKV